MEPEAEGEELVSERSRNSGRTVQRGKEPAADHLALRQSMIDPDIPPPVKQPGHYSHPRHRKVRLEAGLRALAQVLERAEALNLDASLPFAIGELILFGSVLRGADPIGDLDLFATVWSRPAIDHDAMQEWLWQHREGVLLCSAGAALSRRPSVARDSEIR